MDPGRDDEMIALVSMFTCRPNLEIKSFPSAERAVIFMLKVPVTWVRERSPREMFETPPAGTVKFALSLE